MIADNNLEEIVSISLQSHFNYDTNPEFKQQLSEFSNKYPEKIKSIIDNNLSEKYFNSIKKMSKFIRGKESKLEKFILFSIPFSETGSELYKIFLNYIISLELNNGNSIEARNIRLNYVARYGNPDAQSADSPMYAYWALSDEPDLDQREFPELIKIIENSKNEMYMRSTLELDLPEKFIKKLKEGYDSLEESKFYEKSGDLFFNKKDYGSALYFYVLSFNSPNLNEKRLKEKQKKTWDSITNDFKKNIPKLEDEFNIKITSDNASKMFQQHSNHYNHYMLLIESENIIYQGIKDRSGKKVEIINYLKNLIKLKTREVKENTNIAYLIEKTDEIFEWEFGKPKPNIDIEKCYSGLNGIENQDYFSDSKPIIDELKEKLNDIANHFNK